MVAVGEQSKKVFARINLDIRQKGFLRMRVRRLPTFFIFHSGAQFRRADNQGVALVECAIILPLIVLLIIGVYDIGRVLVTYLSLTQIAYEGVRIGGALADLEPSGVSPGGPVDYPDLTDINFSLCALTPNQCFIQQRIKAMLSIYQIDVPAGGDLHDIHILSGFDPPVDPANVGPAESLVRVRISARFVSYFIPFFDLPLGIQITGPYLYSRWTTVPPPCPPDIPPSLRGLLCT